MPFLKANASAARPKFQTGDNRGNTVNTPQLKEQAERVQAKRDQALEKKRVDWVELSKVLIER